MNTRCSGVLLCVKVNGPGIVGRRFAVPIPIPRVSENEGVLGHKLYIIGFPGPFEERTSPQVSQPNHGMLKSG